MCDQTPGAHLHDVRVLALGEGRSGGGPEAARRPEGRPCLLQEAGGRRRKLRGLHKLEGREEVGESGPSAAKTNAPPPCCALPSLQVLGAFFRPKSDQTRMPFEGSEVRRRREGGLAGGPGPGALPKHSGRSLPDGPASPPLALLCVCAFVCDNYKSGGGWRAKIAPGRLRRGRKVHRQGPDKRGRWWGAPPCGGRGGACTGGRVVVQGAWRAKVQGLQVLQVHEGWGGIKQGVAGQGGSTRKRHGMHACERG